MKQHDTINFFFFKSTQNPEQNASSQSQLDCGYILRIVMPDCFNIVNDNVYGDSSERVQCPVEWHCLCIDLHNQHRYREYSPWNYRTQDWVVGLEEDRRLLFRGSESTSCPRTQPGRSDNKALVFVTHWTPTGSHESPLNKNAHELVAPRIIPPVPHIRTCTMRSNTTIKGLENK